MARRPVYSEAEVREAAQASICIADALRYMGLRAAGGNFRSFRRWVAYYGISIDHFDPYHEARKGIKREPAPLDSVLITGSTYNRGVLKHRLYTAGLKQRRCELCGQDEDWNGAFMALILDHVNGDATDNRLENLRIVCPNCNATLDTHCGRRGRVERGPRTCVVCGATFYPKYADNRYCSRDCGVRSRGPTESQPERRKVERPAYAQLKAELAASNYSAVGRRYGVSDNAVRKWMRWYQAAEARRERGGEEPMAA